MAAMKFLAMLTLVCTPFSTLAEGVAPEGDGACLLQKPVGRGADENGLEAEGSGERTAKNTEGISMVETPYLASQTCYGYTGGDCRTSACDRELNAKCRSGRCVCEGACAGADGRCYDGRSNILIAAGFTLTNVKFPGYSMYFQEVSAFAQLKATNADTGLILGRDRLSLYKLPGNESNFHSRFFLGSTTYPTSVARIAQTSGPAVSNYGLYSTPLTADKGPDELALVVCYNHGKGAVMLRSNNGRYWAYLDDGSWLVYAKHAFWQGFIGDEGLWTPSPPFDPVVIAQLPTCF